MFCYHLQLLSVLLQEEAALFSPLTRSPLRCSSIFAACNTRLLIHFLFPNHGAHFSALSYLFPFKNFDYLDFIVTSTLSHQRPCISSALQRWSLGQQFHYLHRFFFLFFLFPATLTDACKTVFYTAYWPFWRDEQNWKLNIFLSKSTSCC